MTVYCSQCESRMVYRDTVPRYDTDGFPYDYVDVFDCTDPDCNNVEEL